MVPWYQQQATKWVSLVTSNFDLVVHLASHGVIASEAWTSLLLAHMDLGGMNVSQLNLPLVQSYLKTHHQTRAGLLEKVRNVDVLITASKSNYDVFSFFSFQLRTQP